MPKEDTKDLFVKHQKYDRLLKRAQAEVPSANSLVRLHYRESRDESTITAAEERQKKLDDDLEVAFPPATVWYAKFWRWLTGAMFQLMIQKHK